MKLAIAALSLATLVAVTPSFAQSIEFGRGGVRVDPRSEVERDRDGYRRYRGDRDVTGSVRGRDCRTVIVREEDDDGEVVSRRVRECN